MTKTKGSWRGIYIDNSGPEANQITFAEIRHAGSATMAGQETTTVQVGRRGKLSMTNSLLDQGKGNGLEAIGDESELVFDLNTVSNHDGHPMVVSTHQVENLDYNTTMINNGKPDTQRTDVFGQCRYRNTHLGTLVFNLCKSEKAFWIRKAFFMI